jgi:hypothetical protein
MQLDAEDDGDMFYKPPAIPVGAASSSDPSRLSGETQVEAAATATAGQED